MAETLLISDKGQDFFFGGQDLLFFVLVGFGFHFLRLAHGLSQLLLGEFLGAADLGLGKIPAVSVTARHAGSQTCGGGYDAYKRWAQTVSLPSSFVFRTRPEPFIPHKLPQFGQLYYLILFLN